MVLLAVVVGIGAREAARPPGVEQGQGLRQSRVSGARQRVLEQGVEEGGVGIVLLDVALVEGLQRRQAGVRQRRQLLPVVAHPRHDPHRHARRVGPPRDGLGLGALVDGEEARRRVGHPGHLALGEEALPLGLARARHRQAPVGPWPHRLQAGEAVGDVAGGVGVEEVVGGGEGVGAGHEVGEVLRLVPRRHPVEAAQEHAGLGPAVGEAHVVGGVDGRDGAVGGVVVGLVDDLGRARRRHPVHRTADR